MSGRSPVRRSGAVDRIVKDGKQVKSQFDVAAEIVATSYALR
jgi:hypothetical protein